MASVTLPGATEGSKISLEFDGTYNTQLALQIQAALQAALNTGNLFRATTDGSGAIPTVPEGKIGELIIVPSTPDGTTISVPGSYSYLVNNNDGPDTIYGSPSLSIIGGGGNHTIIDPAIITLGDTATGSTNILTITGAGDNVAVGNGTNTLTGTGSGTMSGGTGSNDFVAVGSYIVNSLGKDTITAFSGGTTINSSGSNLFATGGAGAVTGTLAGANASLTGGSGALTLTVSGANASITGGSGALEALVSGTSDSIYGGTGATALTLSGSNAYVSAPTSFLTVLDTGVGDTIVGGYSPTAVTATGGAVVYGGSGPLNFVGGTSGSTIFGGSGDGTVVGGTGNTTLFGASGNAFTYVNTTSGGQLLYGAGSGNETVDASLSKGQGVLVGSADPNATALMMAGVGNDVLQAGAGNNTLVGGGGSDTFDFFSVYGGTAQHVVADFSAIDMVILAGYGPNEAAAAVASATTTGGGTTITLSDNTKITFTGMTDASALYNHIASIPTPT